MSSEESDCSSTTSEESESPGLHLPVRGCMASTSQEDCLGAMRGEFIPTNLQDCRVVACMVHGLRYNEAFAESESVKELCAVSANKVFSRSRNARLIMSNKIPLMTDDEEKPYCIWHPDVATVDTYRELVRRYPDMRYNVGRACAVGGYIDLYRELNLLPDISIAEEAWHNLGVVGSKEIFDLITCQPTRYAVLDDYTRSVNWKDPGIATGLNGDTAVLSSLDVTVEFWKEWLKAGRHHFNITEDHSIGETSSPQTHNPPLAPEHVPLLYNPLPLHLPTTNKDALIIHAAYEGNIDRYARLRRPFMVPEETAAVVRGIYHHTAFARWCHDQPQSVFGPGISSIHKAIEARFIMVNDLSRIGTTTNTAHNHFMPFMIWWPLLPQEATLRELARRRPDMMLQVAMTCIAADYRELWEELTPEPHALLWEQSAQRSETYMDTNRNYYVEDLERRAAEKGIDLLSWPGQGNWGDCYNSTRRDKEPTSRSLEPIQVCHVITQPVLTDFHAGSIYPGLQANAAAWELSIAVSDDLREQARTEDGIYLYEETSGQWTYKASVIFRQKLEAKELKEKELEEKELKEKELKEKELKEKELKEKELKEKELKEKELKEKEVETNKKTTA
ncbi:hypothetical protein NHQ30_010714 [Ciborinia camelliae]|nr:hypothetical protein NHQ30_010714 [Ciborinia camelliae]